MPSQADIDAYNDLVAAIRQNSDYRSTDDAAKADVFADSLRQMLALYPSRAQSGGSAGEFLQFDRESQLEMLKDAEEFTRTKRRTAAGQGNVLYWKLCGRSA